MPESRSSGTNDQLSGGAEEEEGWMERGYRTRQFRKLNRRFHQKKPNFTSARNMVSDVLDDDSRKRLSIGAKSLRRPELVTPNGLIKIRFT